MYHIRRKATALLFQHQQCVQLRNIQSIEHVGRRDNSNTLEIRTYSSSSSSNSVTATSPVAPSLENESIMTKIRKKLGWSDNSNARIRVSSYTVYECVADRINYKLFFDTFNLPNTFNSWFLITELHVWMLMVRAMAEGSEKDEDGRFMRNCIVEAMWADVNKRSKELGPQSASSLRKQIYVLSQQFQAALIAYDEAICGDDKLLASVLWVRFFNRNCEDYNKLELLLQYVRKQTKLLDTLSRHDFMIRPKIKWISIQDI